MERGQLEVLDILWTETKTVGRRVSGAWLEARHNGWVIRRGVVPAAFSKVGA